jgi:hypothetical protein
LQRVYGLLPLSPGSDLARELYQNLVLPSRTSSSSSSSSKGLTEQGNTDEPFAAPLQTTTHALHLSPDGKIDPHVDNVEASGSVILGVSLGGERVLRLEKDTKDDSQDKKKGEGWEVFLKSGSVYVQKSVFFPDVTSVIVDTVLMIGLTNSLDPYLSCQQG